MEILSIQSTSFKWYKKIILFGIDAAIINSKILYELKTGKTYTTNEFKENLVKQIFRIYQDYNNQFEDNIFLKVILYIDY